MIFNSTLKAMRLLFFLIFCLSSSFYSQNYDELIRTSDSFRENGDLEKAINYNIKSLKNAYKNNNTEYIVTAYTNIGGILCTRNQHNKSLYFLDLAKKKLNDLKDPIIFSRLYFNYGRNYSMLELFEQSNIYFNKSIQYAKKSNDTEKRKQYMFLGYHGKWDNFRKMDIIDSVQNLQKKSMTLFPEEPLLYDKIAGRYISENLHLDSAEHYINKAIKLNKNNNVLIKAPILLTYGNLHLANNDYEKALECYSEALTIYLKIKHEIGVFNCYKLLSKTYKYLQDKENEIKYLEKYTTLKDNITIREKKVYNDVLEKYIKDKEEDKNIENKRLLNIVSCVLILIILSFYIVYKYSKRKQILETEQLKKKVSTAIDEVSQLAKAKDPFFLIRFKEVYPEFYEKLVTYHSNLTDHDIKIAAYMKLNLSNKEIIQYENITLRAIEMKKYRLKKKLGLASETDFNKWILEL